MEDSNQQPRQPVRVAFFQAHSFEIPIFRAANATAGHNLTFLEARLTKQTAELAAGHSCVCSFVSDQLDKDAIAVLARVGVKLIALRSAGYNHVDMTAAKQHGIPVVRVPAYSPAAVAEHTVCLLLALNRKITQAYMRTHSLNFSLDGLVGRTLFGKKVGVIGTGRIGTHFAQIMLGFGCEVLAYDLTPAKELVGRSGVRYVPLAELYEASDVISLHVPLTPATHHLLGSQALAAMKNDVVILNTSRGALIDSKALITALKTQKIGAAGLDVYEEEEGVFFEDLSSQVLQDDTLARLLTFPNVLITAHQAFLTTEALQSIAKVTLSNISQFAAGGPLENLVPGSCA